MNRRILRSSTFVQDEREIRQEKKRRRTAIIEAYNNPIIRWYCRIRFHIINIDFLDTLEQHLPEYCRVLDMGCGFGLFALYYALSGSQRQVVGFDLDPRRIAEAQAVAAKLCLSNVHFFQQDAAAYEFSQQFDAVVTLDLLHHVPSEVAQALIAQAYQALTPGGVLLVKEVNTRPLHKMYFTYALDKLMAPRMAVHYRSALAWKRVLLEAGFADVLSYPLNDYLPYPHILVVARKG